MVGNVCGILLESARDIKWSLLPSLLLGSIRLVRLDTIGELGQHWKRDWIKTHLRDKGKAAGIALRPFQRGLRDGERPPPPPECKGHRPVCAKSLAWVKEERGRGAESQHPPLLVFVSVREDVRAIHTCSFIPQHSKPAFRTLHIWVVESVSIRSPCKGGRWALPKISSQSWTWISFQQIPFSRNLFKLKLLSFLLFSPPGLREEMVTSDSKALVNQLSFEGLLLPHPASTSGCDFTPQQEKHTSGFSIVCDKRFFFRLS